MARLQKALPYVFPIMLLGAGCATDVNDGGDSQDSDLEPAVRAEAQLNTIRYRSVPEMRPYQLEGVIGGAFKVAGIYQGDSWALAFTSGVSSSTQNSQLITSSLTQEATTGSLTLDWSTRDFSLSKEAGSNPEADDVFTLLLTAQDSSENGESYTEATDAVQVQLDNTPPISSITRICRDAAGTDCFGYTANPADVGATNSSDQLFEVSASAAPRLYVHGVAKDKTFNSYSFRIVGGQSTAETYLCWGNKAENSACVGDLWQAASSFGYGTARDLSYKETLSRANMVDAYSDDTLLMVWDISYLTPDAYGLNLNVGSLSYEDDNDDPTSTSNWITLLIAE